MSWNNYKIGDFLTRSKEPEKIKQQEEYTLVTIRMYHKGVTERSHVKGSSIKSSTLYKVRAGQFILSGIDARNRAFGIVPDGLDGAVVTNDFWTHNIDRSIIDVDFFYWFTTTPQFYEACIKASEGTTNRQRLQADKFYSFDVLLPSIAEQKEWVERISYIQSKYEQLNKELAQQQTYLQLLRQTILQEAVQGKLTKEFATDEPASELLKRIKAEKQKLIKAGKLKKEKELPPITEDEIPFELPEGWVWCRLGDIIQQMVGGGTPSKNNSNFWNGNISWASVKDLKGKYLLGTIDKITQAGVSASSTNIIPKGNIIICTRMGLGKIVLNEVDVAINQDLKGIFLPKQIDKEYFFILYSTLNILGKGTTVDGIRQEQLLSYLIPLPPLAEQQRIVAKVQLLQQQLSQLEAQVQQSREYAQQLLQSVLREAFEEKGKAYQMGEEFMNMVAED